MKNPSASILAILTAAFMLITSNAEAQRNPFDLPGLTKEKDTAESDQFDSSFGDSRDVVRTTFEPQRTTVPPGAVVPVAVIFDFKKDWHIWPQEGGIPEGTALFDGAHWTGIEGLDAENVSIASIQWPKTHTVKADVGDGLKDYAVFSEQAIAYVNIKIDGSAATGSTASITLSATFQACDDSTCLMPTFNDPPSKTITFNVDANASQELSQPPGSRSRSGNAPSPSTFDDWNSDRVRDTPLGQPVDPPSQVTDTPDTEASQENAPSETTFFGLSVPQTGGLFGAFILILLGIAGGFILNLTPCVLPIIPIKIMTLSQHAATPGRALTLGLWMAIGVFVFWVAIGLPVVFFASVTDPSRIFGIWWVTFGIGMLIGVMGLGIMGLFTLSLPQSAYMVNPKADTAWGSFLFGIMTAVLGLPCFGFVAGALFAGAATLPPIVTLLVFGSIGIGMGAPYLVLAAYPALVEKIPRTGPASELVKQVMGLLLIAAAAYFIGSGLITLVLEMPWMARQLHWWAIAIALVIAGLWLMIRTFQITKQVGPRIIWTIVAIIFAFVPTWYAIQVTAKAKVIWTELDSAVQSSTGYSTKVWTPFTPERFEAARAEGKVVVIDFTAEWCINCKALKAAYLDVDPVKSRLFGDDSVVAFTADNTSSNAPGWKFMRELGQTGVPLLAIWGPEDATTSPWKSTAYTASQVIDALNAAEAQ